MKKVLFVLLLAGCASQQMTNPNVTPAEAERDTAECRYEAEKAASGVYDVIARTMRVGELMRMCLSMRGYQ